MEKENKKDSKQAEKTSSPKKIAQKKPSKTDDFKRKYFEFYDDIKISDRQDWQFIMIKHVVCFKLIDSSEKSKLLTKEMLLSMIGNVKLFTDIEVGTDFLQSARSYDVILITSFKSKEDLDAYQVDEYHKNVVKPFMHARVIASVAVDFEY